MSSLLRDCLLTKAFSYELRNARGMLINISLDLLHIWCSKFQLSMKRPPSRADLLLEWDATSSARLSSSHLSEELDDGFTKVQGSKAKRQAQVQAAHVKNTQNYANANGQIGANGTRHFLTKGYTNGRGGPNRARGRGGGRGHGISDHVRGRPSNPAPPPTRSSTQRHRPTSAAELASQRGEPTTGKRLQLYFSHND